MATPIDRRIRLFHGDITSLNCDAIVTAANSALCGGGGVDGAVHNAAGPNFVHASMALAPCPAGDARITEGFDLSAKFVIHAVGPIFSDIETDSLTLASVYESSLSLAAENNLTTIAFPCISTGVFGFPADAACKIAIDTVIRYLQSNDLPESVTFCCFNSADYGRYKELLSELGLLS